MNWETRLSEHFILLDFINCPIVYKSGDVIHIENVWNDEAAQQGSALCRRLLEPLIKSHGPCSISSGWRPYGGGPARSPHNWNDEFGAAADVCFHKWVDQQDRSPISFVFENIYKAGLDFERAITYAGSEYICLSHRIKYNRGAIYENVKNPKTPGEKPFFKRWADSKKDWHKIPHQQPEREQWKRQEGETIYHCREGLAAHHTRIGKYFMLSDFCRSTLGLEQGVRWMPPVMSASLKGQMAVARRFAKILDPFVERYGRISTITGFLPLSLSHRLQTPGHLWLKDREADHKLQFVAKFGLKPAEITDFIESQNDRVSCFKERETVNGDPVMVACIEAEEADV